LFDLHQNIVERTMRGVEDRIGGNEHGKVSRVDGEVRAAHAVALPVVDADDPRAPVDRLLFARELKLGSHAIVVGDPRRIEARRGVGRALERELLDEALEVQVGVLLDERRVGRYGEPVGPGNRLAGRRG
jgi:hypothetical protein